MKTEEENIMGLEYNDNIVFKKNPPNFFGGFFLKGISDFTAQKHHHLI